MAWLLWRRYGMWRWWEGAGRCPVWSLPLSPLQTSVGNSKALRTLQLLSPEPSVPAWSSKSCRAGRLLRCPQRSWQQTGSSSSGLWPKNIWTRSGLLLSVLQTGRYWVYLLVGSYQLIQLQPDPIWTSGPRRKLFLDLPGGCTEVWVWRAAYARSCPKSCDRRLSVQPWL